MTFLLQVESYGAYMTRLLLLVLVETYAMACRQKGG